MSAHSRILVRAGRLGAAVFLFGFILQPAGTFAQPAKASAYGTHVGAPVTPRVVNLRDVSAGNHANANQPALPFRHPGSNLAAAKAAAASLPPGPGIQHIAPGTGAYTPSKVGGGTVLNYTDTTCGCLPPDGGFGSSSNNLIAAVNTAFKILDHSGHLLKGPTEFSAFWGASCESTFSDPVVKYDNAGGHWFMSVVSYNNGGAQSTLCMAVSQTSDPTGTWYLYSFPQQVGGTDGLYDQPRFAFGSDAVFATGNFFQGGSTYLGPVVVALDKTGMESGATVTPISTDLASNYDTLNPVNNIGTSASPYTEAGYFLSADDGNCPPTCTNVYLWKWANPLTGGTLTFQGSVTVTAFAQPVTAKQKGTPSSVVTNDSRELGAYYHAGTIWGTHAISCNPGSGTVDCVQWYQLGNIDAAPTLMQQGIISANAQYRYFPDIAVDKNGDAIIGYSYSSTSDFIGVHFTGRVPTDPSGTMEPEATGVAGGANDRYAGERWGDYATTSIDPNGCTGYHFEEYAPTNAATNIWSTFATGIKFTSCH